jgi:hypothetical protein
MPAVRQAGNGQVHAAPDMSTAAASGSIAAGAAIVAVSGTTQSLGAAVPPQAPPPYRHLRRSRIVGRKPVSLHPDEVRLPPEPTDLGFQVHGRVRLCPQGQWVPRRAHHPSVAGGKHCTQDDEVLRALPCRCRSAGASQTGRAAAGGAAPRPASMRRSASSAPRGTARAAAAAATSACSCRRTRLSGGHALGQSMSRPWLSPMPGERLAPHAG